MYNDQPQKKANAESEIEPLLSEIKTLFEQVNNRRFDITFPTKIEGADFYKIVVSGNLESNRTYPIDTIAVFFFIFQSVYPS